MTTKPIAALFLDPTIYPRHDISSTNISDMVEAIRAGIVLPPVVVDTKTLTVIDGFHRIRAYEKLYGSDYEIAVESKVYKNRAAMFADAVSLNKGRGLDLSRWDVTRCLTVADEVGLPFETLAQLIHWQPERLAKYRDSRMGRTLDDRKLALKRSLRHKINQPLTERQEAANERLSGMQAGFHANQLVILFENDLMPLDDPKLNDQLDHLAVLIEQHRPDRQTDQLGA